MWVQHVETVLPCIADLWKLRIIVHLDEKPDLFLISKYLKGKYSEKLGMMVVRMGIKELNLFQKSQVTIRMVDFEQVACDLVNGLLAMAYHKAMIAGKSKLSVFSSFYYLNKRIQPKF